jgi:putative glutamine amidotransferase
MRHAAILLALVLGLCFSSSSAQDTLLLFHPTAYNLLDLEGYHVLGVYHAREAYDYGEAREWLSAHPGSPCSIREVSCELGAQELFGQNDCSGIFRKLFNNSRGALFMGGPDIPPELYGEKVYLLTRVTDPFRHLLECSYLFHILGGTQDPGWIPLMEENRDYLVSGICLGMQTMAVATGGTLVQDIPTEVYGIWNAEEVLSLPPDQIHLNYEDMLLSDCGSPTSYHFHRIQPVKRSFLSKGLGYHRKALPLVLSSHHQAVEIPGQDWRVAATSMDGKIVEAMEHIDYPHVVAVQFHPEKPGLFDPSIVQAPSCGDSISFGERIKGTDSFAFHKAYWHYLGKNLQKLRTP